MSLRQALNATYAFLLSFGNPEAVERVLDGQGGREDGYNHDHGAAERARARDAAANRKAAELLGGFAQLRRAGKTT